MFEVFEVFSVQILHIPQSTFAANRYRQQKRKVKNICSGIDIKILHGAIRSFSIKQLSVEVHIVKMRQGFEDKV